MSRSQLVTLLGKHVTFRWQVLVKESWTTEGGINPSLSCSSLPALGSDVPRCDALFTACGNAAQTDTIKTVSQVNLSYELLIPGIL